MPLHTSDPALYVVSMYLVTGIRDQAVLGGLLQAARGEGLRMVRQCYCYSRLTTVIQASL